jgi:hypothetical protein
MQEPGLSFVEEATRAELVVPETLQGVCAGPDALLKVRGSKLLLEAKCPWPFVQRADHLEWEHVSYPVAGLQPRVYAHCQFHIMVTGVYDCLVIWWWDGDRNQSRLLRFRYDTVWYRAVLEILGTAITSVRYAQETESQPIGSEPEPDQEELHCLPSSYDDARLPVCFVAM